MDDIPAAEQAGNCLVIQYNSQIVTCETAQNSTDPMNLGTGNLASGIVDILQKKTLMCNVQQMLPAARSSQCIPTGPRISPYAGGNSSGALLNGQMMAYASCMAATNRAVAELKSSVPVCARSPNVLSAEHRFAKYQRWSPPAPCPPPPSDMIIPSNPAVPRAVDGPCVIVPGIVYNRIN